MITTKMKPYGFIIENGWLRDRIIGWHIGWGNGYVAIPPKHRWYQKDFDYLNDRIKIHGGITFCRRAREIIGPVKEYLINDVDYWVIGFDTGHYMDSIELWPRYRVKQEAEKLLQQVIAAGKWYYPILKFPTIVFFFKGQGKTKKK
jgi:hypothetical protein